jgi:hypothetical protein
MKLNKIWNVTFHENPVQGLLISLIRTGRRAEEQTGTAILVDGNEKKEFKTDKSIAIPLRITKNFTNIESN